MIQNGDKFTASDLIRAVDELRGCNMSQYLSKQVTPKLIPGKDDIFHNLNDMTPDSYADSQIELYDIKSSATALDDALRHHGYKTTHRFAHKYNIHGIDPNRVARDAYRLEYFYKYATTSVRRDIKSEHRNTFWQNCDDVARVSYYYAQYIWATNPDTRFDYENRFDMYSDWGFILRFLLGTGFGFAPRDVYYFVTEHSYRSDDASILHDQSTKQQQVFKDWCMNKYGIDTGCLVLHPESQEKLRKILTRTDTPYAIQLALKYLKMLSPVRHR